VSNLHLAMHISRADASPPFLDPESLYRLVAHSKSFELDNLLPHLHIASMIYAIRRTFASDKISQRNVMALNSDASKKITNVKDKNKGNIT